MCDCLPPLILAFLLIDFSKRNPELFFRLQLIYLFFGCTLLCYLVYQYPKLAWNMTKPGFNLFVSVVVTDFVNWAIGIVNYSVGTNYPNIVFTPL